MRRAKVAVVVGALMMLLGFCFGVETPISTTVAGEHYACSDVITPSVLVAGAPRTTLPAQATARCAPLEARAAWLVWGGICLGGLILLSGWTVLRERALPRLRLQLPEAALP